MHVEESNKFREALWSNKSIHISNTNMGAHFDKTDLINNKIVGFFMDHVVQETNHYRQFS